jgi:hypothetical protein
VNTFTFTARKRCKNGHVDLVLIGEVDEDSYAHGPFLRFKAEPQPFARSFELCFHRGWPKGPPKTGRRVQFEHVAPDLPDHVYLIRIYLENGEFVKIESQSKTRPPASSRERRY